MTTFIPNLQSYMPDTIQPEHSRATPSTRSTAPVRQAQVSFSRMVLLLLASLGACQLVAASQQKAIVPRETISLFNGKDLSSFYTWLAKIGYTDHDRVFTVVDNIDGRPAIRISGQHYGGIVTPDSYANYKLVAEYRWGSISWEPRKTRPRDSGILLHCQGPDGNRYKTFDGPWMRSVEYQITEGGTGDIILVNGFDKGVAEQIAPRLTVRVLPETRIWNPAGVPTEFHIGRIDWQHRDPNRKDEFGFRGPKDVERVPGEWNLIEVICSGGDVDYFLNGIKVNEGRNGSMREGKILFQSEGAEIFFRRIELQPLAK